MSISVDLLARLNTLQEEPQFNPAGQRIISLGDPADNATAILNEIDQTILARQLSFTTGSGDVLSLDVVGRRALRVVAGGGAVEAGKYLTESDDLDDFLQMVLGFGHEAKEVSVINNEPSEGLDSSIVGLAAARMMKRIKDIEYAPESGSVAQKILNRIPDADIWLIIRGEDAGESFGDNDLIETLREFADSQLESIDSHLDSLAQKPDAAVATIIGNLSGDGKVMLCLRTGDQLAFAVLPTGSVSTTMLAWQRFALVN